MIKLNPLNMALSITDANFAELVENSDKPVVLDFWAEWCGPCRMIAPHIEKMANDYEGRAVIGKVDVDNNPGLNTAEFYKYKKIFTMRIMQRIRSVNAGLFLRLE